MDTTPAESLPVRSRIYNTLKKVLYKEFIEMGKIPTRFILVSGVKAPQPVKKSGEKS